MKLFKSEKTLPQPHLKYCTKRACELKVT